MIQKFYIEATDETPKIDFDPSREHFEISGISMPEDVLKFYSPIQVWVEAYIQKPLNSTIIKVKLDYFNSSSAKYLVRLLQELEKIKGNSVKMLWYYHEEDDLMLERGEELQLVLKLPIELHSYNDDDE